jgi:hypothetical protein
MRVIAFIAEAPAVNTILGQPFRDKGYGRNFYRYRTLCLSVRRFIVVRSRSRPDVRRSHLHPQAGRRGEIEIE